MATTRKSRKSIKSKARRRHQPRLRDNSRVPAVGMMCETILAGLRAIARQEKKSVSWVVHEIIAEFFGKDIMGEEL